jgi:hypothetical protein
MTPGDLALLAKVFFPWTRQESLVLSEDGLNSSGEVITFIGYSTSFSGANFFDNSNPSTFLRSRSPTRLLHLKAHPGNQNCSFEVLENRRYLLYPSLR